MIKTLTSGRHTVEISIEGQPVDGSPFSCNVYNINNIKVTGLDSAKVCVTITKVFFLMIICHNLD